MMVVFVTPGGCTKCAGMYKCRLIGYKYDLNLIFCCGIVEIMKVKMTNFLLQLGIFNQSIP